MSSHGEYNDCYVAFLDILGFRQMVDRSAVETDLFRQISDITTLAAQPRSGVKQTSLGPCVMQLRAFSDSIVAFTPTRHENQNACNPLSQLCFVVRHLHDQVLGFGACLRGGLTVGKMFWHPSWNAPAVRPRRGSRGALPITFGPALNAAYDLERTHAVYPRVIVDEPVAAAAQREEVSGLPFAKHGALADVLRCDPTDGKFYLDFLNPVVARSAEERMQSSPDGFTIAWAASAESSHSAVIQRTRDLAQAGIRENAECERVRQKYVWLLAATEPYIR